MAQLFNRQMLALSLHSARSRTVQCSVNLGKPVVMLAHVLEILRTLELIDVASKNIVIVPENHVVFLQIGISISDSSFQRSFGRKSSMLPTETTQKKPS